jgi:bacteriocin biosynthesis cyclodehydratase domain-containing protein
VTHPLRPSPPRPGPHPPHTVLLAAGDFGHRVAAGISAGMRNGSGRATVVDVQAAPWSAHWPAGDVYVLCSDRPRPRTADRVDAAAAVWRRPWFTVALDHPDLRVGPVVRPGTTACHACFEARRRQHAGARAEALAALETRYSDESATGVGGFADHHVTAATALSRLVLTELLAGLISEPTGETTEGATWAGTVTTLGTVTADLRRHRVVASDRCERCQGPVTTRDVDDLAPYRNLLCPAGVS